MLDDATRPTAVFCTSDLLAVGALRAALERDVRVPERLAMIGYAEASPQANPGWRVAKDWQRRRAEGVRLPKRESVTRNGTQRGATMAGLGRQHAHQHRAGRNLRCSPP